MEKKRYFVHPKTGVIMEQRDPQSFAFEIEATELELKQLRDLFTELADEDTETFFDGFLPFQQEEAMENNMEYHELLTKIYNQLYQLGTDQSKQKLKSLRPEKR